MKQTAIQQAIVMVRNRMESMNDTLMGKHTAHHLQQVERDLYDLLEAEKEMIMAAVNYGCSDWGSAKDAEDYYKEFSQAFRWFREKYDLSISITHYENGYSINDLRRFDTYEEAELECIKKLIKIVNTKRNEKEIY